MFAYTGSGPYCYTHSLSIMLGPQAPPAAVTETLTGSPFGFTMIGGRLPLFDPYGWDPEIGLDVATALLGWRCTRVSGGTPAEALARLRAACVHGPVLVGPLDMRRLSYQSAVPPDGDLVDHYLVVLSVRDETVLVHDPQGFPYATLPTTQFVASWQAEQVPYVDEPFVQRSAYTRDREVAPVEALAGALPRAVQWLSGRHDLPMPPGSLHGAEAVAALADQVALGLDADVRELLVEFGLRVGARRLVDAAECLGTLGLSDAAGIADEQARIIGGLQHPLVAGQDQSVITGLRRLAPSYERLRVALADGLRHSG